MGTTRRRGGDGGMEENTMAILDTSCFSKSTQHIADDRLSFLEAVRSGFLVPENAPAHTNKIYKEIFQILRVENSLYLIMSSYQLLLEFDKRFPQVYLSTEKKSESSSPSSLPCNELVVVEEMSLLVRKKIMTKLVDHLIQLHLIFLYKILLKCQISLPSKVSSESKEDNNDDNSFPDVCNHMISAFTCLRKTNGRMVVLPFGKEALFTAAIMLSGNSGI